MLWVTCFVIPAFLYQLYQMLMDYCKGKKSEDTKVEEGTETEKKPVADKAGCPYTATMNFLGLKEPEAPKAVEEPAKEDDCCKPEGGCSS